MPVDRNAPVPRAGHAIYVLAAHPRWRDSRVNRRLLEVARTTPGVDLNDLYSTYPDYAIDVAAEQQRVERADLIVLMHPVQWYSMPALLKLWLDDVLTWGWAYGREGTALLGKDLWLVASTGGGEASYRESGYNQHTFEAFLPPYAQTATLCGMRFLPPLVFHGARSARREQVDAHVADFGARLASYPQWPELATLPAPVCGPIPATDRPTESA